MWGISPFLRKQTVWVWGMVCLCVCQCKYRTRVKTCYKNKIDYRESSGGFCRIMQGWKHSKISKEPLLHSNTSTIGTQKRLYRIITVDVFNLESTYKKCLREEWGKFAGYQLLSSFWLKVARTDEDGNTTRWDRGTLPIRNLYPKWRMLRFGRMRKVTN